MTEPRVRRVPVVLLDATSFGPYGAVIEAGASDDPTLNRAPGHMAYMWIHRDLEYPATPFIATCRYYARGARCEYLQKHPASTVVLIPLDGQPSVIWVALDRDGRPDLDTIAALLLDGRRGVVLNPGTWIRYAYPVLGMANFAYVSARRNPEDDIVRYDLETGDGVVLEWYIDAPSVPGVDRTAGGAVKSLPPPDGRELDLGVGGTVRRAPAPDGTRQ